MQRLLRPRVCVYAIAKDEATHVDRFMLGVRDADAVLIADTGSTDDTIARAEAAGAIVRPIMVEPWRFDVARNKAMARAPKGCEILFALDLDEVPQAGWRQAIDKSWHGNTNQLRYTEVWSHRPDGSPDRVLPKMKIHNRDFYWRCPVHEVLVPRKGHTARYEHCDLVVDHWPDPQKSRGSYLPLLKLAVEEDPTDDRMAHYYARELMYAGQHAEAVVEFERHLALPKAKWRPERAASMRFAAECEAVLGEDADAEMWLLRACAEEPTAREGWLALGRFYLRHDAFGATYFAAHRALAVTQRTRAYTEHESSWREAPHDILSVAAWYLGKKEEARRHVNIAIAHAPFDERIQANHRMMEGVTIGAKGA